MDFPLDTVFMKSETEKSGIVKFGRILQWVLTLASCAFLICYLFLCGIWCILGAILNPNMFLPYASGAITFITFVKSKYAQFKEVSKNGETIVMEFLNKLTAGVMNKVLQILSNRIEGATRYVADKSKDLINGPVFQGLSDKLTSAGIISEQDVQDMKTKISSIDSNMVMTAASAAISNPQMIVDSVENMVDGMVTSLEYNNLLEKQSSY
jgi:hypothetical protein